MDGETKKKAHSGTQVRQVFCVQTHLPSKAGALFRELRLLGKGLSVYRLAQALMLETLERFQQMPPEEREAKLQLLLQRHGFKGHSTYLKS